MMPPKMPPIRKRILTTLLVVVTCVTIGVLLCNLNSHTRAAISGSICGALAAIPTALFLTRKGKTDGRSTH